MRYTILLLIVILLLQSCGGGKKEMTAEQADYWEPVTFRVESNWSQAEKDAALRGFNTSEGAFRWNVWFYEGPMGIDMSFYPYQLAKHIVDGKSSEGFSHLNTIGISYLWDNSISNIEMLSRHEIDHWLGRKHKTDEEMMTLKNWNRAITESMTWAPWPETTQYPLKPKPVSK